MKTLLIEGWRGINQSYAMVNQNQLLALLKRGDINVLHADLPFANPRWGSAGSGGGFGAEDLAALKVKPYGGEPVDATYRIVAPFRFWGGNSPKVFCYATSEHQMLDPALHLAKPNAGEVYSNPKFQIVTPSHWSKAGFVKSGFAEEDVIVIPHGVNPAIFYPQTAEENAATRNALGLSPGQFAFLNVSMMAPNKGIDFLLMAFSYVHRRYPSSALILKDQRHIYGQGAQEMIAQVKNYYGAAIDDRALAAVRVVSSDLTLGELRALYSASDAYVSPYRAEGFNIPPLEAAACGTPVIVTGGGPTDDYYHPSFMLKVASTKKYNGVMAYLEPDIESLVAHMEDMIEKRARGLDPDAGRRFVVENFSWDSVAEKLVALF